MSSFSPKSVQAIPTEAVITGDSASPTQQVRFEAAPTDLRLHELASSRAHPRRRRPGHRSHGDIDYRYLYAAIPELGQIAQIQVITTTGPTARRTSTALSARHSSSRSTLRLRLGHAGAFAAVGRERLQPHLPEDFQRSPGPVHQDRRDDRRPASTGRLRAEPSRARDRSTVSRRMARHDDVLLVADANQPVIHRFTLVCERRHPDRADRHRHTDERCRRDALRARQLRSSRPGRDRTLPLRRERDRQQRPRDRLLGRPDAVPTNSAPCSP